MKFNIHFSPVLKAIAHGIFFLAICLASFALGHLLFSVPIPSGHPQTIQPAKECW